MTNLNPIKYGELTLVQEIDGKVTTLTGKVRNPVIENQVDFEEVSSMWGDSFPIRQYDQFLFSAEFVRNDAGFAYVVREEKEKDTVVSRSAIIKSEGASVHHILEAQKAVGAPEGATPKARYYPAKHGYVIEFTWEEYV